MEEPRRLTIIFKWNILIMKVIVELYGATKDLSNKNFLEFKLKNKSSIKDIKFEILKLIDRKFKGNKNYKKIIKNSAFCSEGNNIVSDSYKITKDQKIGIIPPIGGGWCFIQKL